MKGKIDDYIYAMRRISALKGITSASSTYEAIYEPFNRRGWSQLSSRSKYPRYAPYGSRSNRVMTGPSASRMGLNVYGLNHRQTKSVYGLNKYQGLLKVNVYKMKSSQDQEVDLSIDLLVQDLVNEDCELLDTYGHCTKCKVLIAGASNGCTALSRLYHTNCFTCHQCGVILQGKPFHDLNGEPYCEEDYFNNLEKCCVCQELIMDKVSRVTGKPYHPGCFCCIVCGESLDGRRLFTVDARNRFHCMDDYHIKMLQDVWFESSLYCQHGAKKKPCV